MGPGSDPEAKSAPAQALQKNGVGAQGADDKRKEIAKAGKLTAEEKSLVVSIGEMIEAQDWMGLLSLEREALTVANKLRHRAAANSAVIYGNLGHAHMKTVPSPHAVAPIYADHGMLPRSPSSVVPRLLQTPLTRKSPRRRHPELGWKGRGRLAQSQQSRASPIQPRSMPYAPGSAAGSSRSPPSILECALMGEARAV
jgi:hypothetical protein